MCDCHLLIHHPLRLEQLLPDPKGQQAAVEEAHHARVVALKLLYQRDVRHRALEQRERQRALVWRLGLAQLVIVVDLKGELEVVLLVIERLVHLRILEHLTQEPQTPVSAGGPPRRLAGGRVCVLSRTPHKAEQQWWCVQAARHDASAAPRATDAL